MSGDKFVNADSPISESAVYNVEDVQKLLYIGRSTAYNFIYEVYKTQYPFRVFKIGTIYRIPKRGFDAWLFGKDDANA